jgi:hypothetical protein
MTPAAEAARVPPGAQASAVAVRPARAAVLVSGVAQALAGHQAPRAPAARAPAARAPAARALAAPQEARARRALEATAARAAAVPGTRERADRLAAAVAPAAAAIKNSATGRAKRRASRTAVWPPAAPRAHRPRRTRMPFVTGKTIAAVSSAIPVTHAAATARAASLRPVARKTVRKYARSSPHKLRVADRTTPAVAVGGAPSASRRRSGSVGVRSIREGGVSNGS